MTLTVYLAGPYSSREHLKEYAAELTEVGFKVQASWLNGTHEVNTNGKVEADATAEQLAGWAFDDMRDITACDILVGFTSASVGGGGTSGGRHVETGFALGLRKTVLIVGEPENVFHRARGVQLVGDWHSALIVLSGRLVEHVGGQPHSAVERAS